MRGGVGLLWSIIVMKLTFHHLLAKPIGLFGSTKFLLQNPLYLRVKISFLKLQMMLKLFPSKKNANQIQDQRNQDQPPLLF